MKRLTINHISAATIRANRKTYLSLAVGVFLAVYLAVTFTVCAYGVIRADRQTIIDRVGVTDCVLYDEPDVTDDFLRQSGFFDQMGHVYLTARVKDSDVYLGYTDEMGESIVHPSCAEGRMPEQAGELALEQGVLEKLRLEAKLGDTVTLTLQAIDGVEEERSFTLVGILNEQSIHLDRGGLDFARVTKWPAVRISAEEPAFTAGRTAVHRVLTYAPLVSYNTVKNNRSFTTRTTGAVSRTDGAVRLSDPRRNDMLHYFTQTVALLILGAALLLSTGVGISSAMESVLAARTEEIGMLRAVGATRRQIRRIFGRDPWLLSLAALPVGLLMGCLTAWLFSLIRPESLKFSFSLWLLLPVSAVSAACIYLSSALPLRRAAQQTPLGVLRDTAMLRRAKGFKSKSEFKPTALIAGRQLRLHPLRQVGAVLMVTLMLFICAFLGELTFNVLDEERNYTFTDFYLSYDRWIPVDSQGLLFAEPERAFQLSEQDLEQIRALPHVDHASLMVNTFANLVLDGEIPDYFKTYCTKTFQTNDGDIYVSFDTISFAGKTPGIDWLLLEDETPEPSADDPKAYNDYMAYWQMRAAADALGAEGKLLPIEIYVTDIEHSDFALYVAEGKIDLAALDAGTQVIAQAPSFAAWAYRSGVNAESYINGPVSHMPEDVEVLGRVDNDFFYAGQTLELKQLINGGVLSSAAADSLDYDGNRAAYAAMERHDVNVTVGAVLSDSVAGSIGNVVILTTEKGAKALGLRMTGNQNVSVALDGAVDEETEAALETELKRIAMRADMIVYNYLENLRENQKEGWTVLLLFGGMALLFFVVSVTMQVGNASRRIRADRYTIGTLRAVGADEKALLGGYRLPVFVTTVMGTVLGLLLYLWSCGFFWSGLEYCHPWVMLPALAAVGAGCALCCLLGLRGRLHREMGRSIVENIREL